MCSLVLVFRFLHIGVLIRCWSLCLLYLREIVTTGWSLTIIHIIGKGTLHAY